MCGIGGFSLTSPSAVDDVEGVLFSMMRQMFHRGPDGSGAWVSPHKGTGLCHTRLSIVDLSEQGHQPMRSLDQRYSITFNGEIYNWKEIKKELETRGYRFFSDTDTEVLLNSYICWGDQALQRLRGMFAFAIWDEMEQVLFCARDPMGKKPFVYSENHKGFFFASEIPAIRVLGNQIGLDATIDPSALGAMMLHNLRHIPEPATVFKGVRKLRPGHAMMVQRGRISAQWRYWSPKPKDISGPEELRVILENAVNIRSKADVPVAALLSGGVDSTSIVNLMKQNSSEPIRTYCFGRDGNDEDIIRARHIAKKLGTIHKEMFFDPSTQLEIFHQINKTYGEPIMLLPLIHSYQLSDAIRNDGVKVVLNGNGADELFFGYTGHLRTAQVTKLLNAFGWLRHVLPNSENSLLSVLKVEPGKRKAELYKRKAKSIWPSYFDEDAIGSFSNIPSEEMTYWGPILPHDDFIDESNYLSLFIENTHSVTLSGDLPAMMASVEMRSPFLDLDVVSAAMGIHFSRKVEGPKDGSQLKKILRDAVRDLVSPVVMDAPKRGFGMGIQERDVLLQDWSEQADSLFYDFPELDIFDRGKISKQWQLAKSGSNVNWSEIAKLFSIGMWVKNNV